MKSGKFFPILSLIFFLSTCWLLFIQLQTQLPNIITENQDSTIKPEKTNLNQENQKQREAELAELQRLRILENEHKELKLLLERMSTELKVASEAQKSFQRMIMGRAMLREFEKRFVHSKLFKEAGGFISFIRIKTKNYLSRGEFRLASKTMSKEEWNKFHSDVSQWLVKLTKEEVEGGAEYMSFFFAESLYEIPLTILASRLVPELESIDFNTPVLMAKTLNTPQRDEMGELKISKPVFLDQYTVSQEFFYRRGPKITEKTIIFLKAYLNYTEI